MRALVLADTHVRGERVATFVESIRDRIELADVILHAGDIVDPALLDLLGRSAPVLAVRGNNDTAELPDEIDLDLGGLTVAMVHDGGPAAARGSRLKQRFPSADVVVFGHSHLPWHEVVSNGPVDQHHFNPGSPTQRRRAPHRTIGWIDTDRHGNITCSHENLD